MQAVCHHLYLILLILTLVPFQAGAGIRIHGKITDSHDAPVEFATVRVAGTAIGATSGLEGEYSLTCAEADTVTLHFSCIGFRTEKKVLIGPSGDVTLNVRLQYDSERLKQVEVVELKRQTGSVSSVDAASLRRNPDASGGSVESLITTMAGVTASNELSSRYSVRGGSYDENLVYINGVELNRPQFISSGEQEGLSVINPDMVESIGFSTGGFPACYGDRMSSALDIVYRRPDSFEGSVSASLMGASLSIGQGSKRFSQLHGVRYKRNTSILGSLDTKGEYDPHFFDYQTSIAWQMNNRLKLSFLGNIALNRYRFTPVDRTTAFGTVADSRQFKVYFDGSEKDRFDTYSGALAFDYRAGQATTLRLLVSGYLSDELVTNDISGEYWLDQAGTSGEVGELGVGRYHEHARDRLKLSLLTLALSGESSLSSRNTLSYGVTAQTQKIMERSRDWELRDSSGYSLPSVSGDLRVIYNLLSRQDESSRRFSAFVQDVWRVSGSSGFLAVNAGLRASYWTYNREFLLSPRISLGFIPDNAPQWTLRFATGLYYQSPIYKEYRVPVADTDGNQVIRLNPDIKSPRSLQFIAGTDYTFRALGRPFRFSVEAYYKALSRLIPYEIDNLRLIYSGRNEADGYVAGLDMKLFGQFVPGSDSWVSVSVMKSNEKLYGINVPLPTDRRYSLGIFFTDYFPKFPKLKFSLKGILMDGLPAVAPHTSRADGYFRMPPYKRVDVGLSYALVAPPEAGEYRSGLGRTFKSVWLGVDVFNLLDIANVASYYWVTDVNNIRYAVPNYLTRRQFNVRLVMDF